MTLSPVFRSARAVQLLGQNGIWKRLTPALLLQTQAAARVHEDFAQLIEAKFRLTPEEWQTEAQRETAELENANGKSAKNPAELENLQNYFFLTLFLNLFENLGIAPVKLPFYAEFNFTIMGTITAADNLFDDQAKSLLPLRSVAGARFASILQLMSFERLARIVGDRAIAAGLFGANDFACVQRSLMDQMAEIGLLEGSEEDGVHEIPPPQTMIERVHRIRGGSLFGLAFAAPKVLEAGLVGEKLRKATPAIERLGTAFQIVDDLTDFEFDLGRRSHNLLVAQIQHHGRPQERSRLKELWSTGKAEKKEVETLFADSARAVLDLARSEARAAFSELATLGYWFPTELTDEVVYAIVGMDGLSRMEALLDG